MEYWKKIWNGFIAFLPVLLVLVSLALYAEGFFRLVNDPLQSVIYSVASAILAGGVFAALLKSLQFLGVFRDAIADVMYRDPMFLERLDLPELTRSIISATIAQRFPELAKSMSKAVFSDYLTFAKDYHYENMHRRIIILSYDATTDIIQFREEFRLTIKAAAKQEISYAFLLNGDHPATIPEIPCEVTSLAVNNVSFKDSVRTASKDGNYQLGYEIKLVGRDTYDVTRTMLRRHVLATDPFVKAVSTRFLDGAELIVENRVPTKIAHTLIAIGTDDSALVPDAGMVGDTKRWRIDRLIFPRQGYILIFIKKLGGNPCS